jgi:hypothetical protein
MVLVWNDISSFRRHLENMKTFRQSHLDGPPVERFKLLNEMPQQLDSIPSCRTRIIESFAGTKSKVTLVPIWQVNPPRGSQN